MYIGDDKTNDNIFLPIIQFYLKCWFSILGIENENSYSLDTFCRTTTGQISYRASELAVILILHLQDTVNVNIKVQYYIDSNANSRTGDTSEYYIYIIYYSGNLYSSHGAYNI